MKTPKTKTITLIYLENYIPFLGSPTKIGVREEHDGYRVEQITDTLSPRPGEVLTRQVVSTLCNDDEWRVIIKGPKL